VIPRPKAQSFTPALLAFAAAIAAGGAAVQAHEPEICKREGWSGADGGREPAAVADYFRGAAAGVYDQRDACARWAGTYSATARASGGRSSVEPLPARFIVFPAAGIGLKELAGQLGRGLHIHSVETASRFLVVSFARGTPLVRLRDTLANTKIEYSEPDCDGPDFLTTSIELLSAGSDSSSCWQRAARADFPNDPCIDELWGHRKIGWNSDIAARSLPRVVAVLDSGIDADHEDLTSSVMINLDHRDITGTQGSRLNARCATSGRCYPHGTEMAGTIGGRMDNGLGVAGVAPNSLLLPIVISRVDHGLLARLSTIAEGIDAAVRGGADVINISAKWPVDSRAISESIYAAVGGDAGRRRLVVTGYATSLERDESVREYFPSRYRCLPGVVAAVPTDMRGRDLFNPVGRPNATDGRIQAPGVDIVVTTTENSAQGYALSEAAGASSAAAYVSGAVALVWGSPPLNKCDAQQIKQLLFCRSKTSGTSRYPWINVDFLGELGKVDAGADCRAAMQALGCT
jgi:Subtilase family